MKAAMCGPTEILIGDEFQMLVTSYIRRLHARALERFATCPKDYYIIKQDVFPLPEFQVTRK